MPVFEYSVRQRKGRSKLGTIAADSARQARDQLRADGFSIESIRPLEVGQSNESAAPLSIKRRNSSAMPVRRSMFERRHGANVSWFIREIATLLSVGTPIVESLQLAIDQSKGVFRNLLLDIRERITQGASLGSALRAHHAVFGSVLCEMVAVGEQSGSLPNVLAQAAEFRDRRDRLKNRVLSAMLYPALVLLLSVAVTIFLMTVVVPTLISSLAELHKELPLPTRILKAISDLLLQYGAYVGLMLVACMFAFLAALKRPRGRALWDRLLLKLPIFGTLMVKQNCSRLCLVTGTLLRSGVDLVRALEIAETGISNVKIRETVTTARTKIASGAELGSALRTNSVLPAALIQVFALGQHTGQLDDLLFRIAEDYDQQVNQLADRLTTIMEPVLIVALSVIVGFIMLATLLPILESGNVLSE